MVRNKIREFSSNFFRLNLKASTIEGIAFKFYVLSKMFFKFFVIMKTSNVLGFDG